MPFQPYCADGADPTSHPGQTSSQMHNLPVNSKFDWGSLLQSPLDAATFAALESSGVVKPPFQQPASGSFTQSSFPSSTVSSLNSSHAHSAPHHHRESWPSTATPPYSPNFLASDSQRTSPSQSPRSAGAISHIRGRASVSSAQGSAGVQSFSAAAAKQEQQQQSGADRPRPEPKGFVNLQQVINHRPSIAHRRSGQSGFGSGNGPMPTGMRLGMPPMPMQIPAHLGASSPSPLYPSSGERTHHVNLPPSLWMSPMNSSSITPTQTTIPSRTPPSSTYPSLSQLTMPAGYSEATPSSASSSRPSSSPFVSGSASTHPTSAASDARSPSLYSGILAEDLFLAKTAAHLPSPTSPGRGSPDLMGLGALDSSDGDIEKMAEKDPLAAQVWRLYARTKANLPHAQRMENLTWRMMTLALKKREEEARNRSSQTGQNEQGPAAESAPELPKTAETDADEGAAGSSSKPSLPQIKTEPELRGRRPDKTAARVRVVGFEGKNQDGEDEECVRRSNLHLVCARFGF